MALRFTSTGPRLHVTPTGYRASHAPPEPPTRRPPPADPGDLTWTPYVMPSGPRATHWIRTDRLELFLRPGSFTIAHDGRVVTEADVAEVVTLLGLSAGELRCTFSRVPNQREYALPGGKLKPLIDEVLAAMPLPQVASRTS